MRRCTLMPASRAATGSPPTPKKCRPPGVWRRYHHAMAARTTVIAKLCGTSNVRPATPRPNQASVSGMPLTVCEPKICRPTNRNRFAVPKVMMMACTRP